MEIWAEQALLATGWARDVRVSIGADGCITGVQPGAARWFDAGGSMAIGSDSNIRIALAAGCDSGAIALDAPHLDLAGRQGDAVLDSFIFAGDECMVRHVWSAGRHVVKAGQHINRQEIMAAYRKAMRDLGQTL